MAERPPPSLRLLLLAAAGVALGLIVATCGGTPAIPTSPPTPPPATPTPTPSPTPTPGGLPPGMVCSPTPPPLLRMHLKVHSDDGGRIVLDSKPLVVNVDNYCEKVGFGNWKFCDTRPEGDAQRVACDYLVTGKAEDTGRWGPTWFYGSDLCSYFPDDCANHPSEQFMAIARSKGTYEACAEEAWPVAGTGTRCGTIEIK
jgi:hypothetical protein